MLIELGYALKSISSERVILVFNTISGDVSELPFDLRFKRVLTYNMGEHEKPALIRTKLRKAFKDALIGIFRYFEDSVEDNEKTKYLASLNASLTKIILFGEESRQRTVNPWAQEVLDSFESENSKIRMLAAEEMAFTIGITEKLEILINQLNEAIDSPRVVGREAWQNFNNLVDAAVGTAWQLKGQYIDTIPLHDNSKLQISEALGQKLRILTQDIARYEKSSDDLKDGLFDNVRYSVSEFAYIALQISYYNLNTIKPNLSAELREIAKPLHIIELRYEMSGNDSEVDFINEVKERLSKIESIMEGAI